METEKPLAKGAAFIGVKATVDEIETELPHKNPIASGTSSDEIVDETADLTQNSQPPAEAAPAPPGTGVPSIP